MKITGAIIADIIAIIFFVLLVLYFYMKMNRTNIENVSFMFTIAALLCDIIFGCIFIV
jgi:hypothetical protein